MSSNDADDFEMEVPVFIELRESLCVSNDLGAFCRVPLSADQFIGNYKGKIRKAVNQIVDQEYYWTVNFFSSSFY